MTEDAYQLIVDHAHERKLRDSAVAAGHRPLLLDGLSMASQGITSFDELRALGSFYVPPAGTPAAHLVRQALGVGTPRRAPSKKKKPSRRSA